MKVDDIYVAGVGVCLPETVPVEDAVAEGRYDADEAAMSGWTGAAVAGDVPAPTLAVHAARQAVDRSGHEPDDFALVIHASTNFQGPELWPTASYIQRHTIGGDAPSLEIKQACSGLLTSIELSCAYLGRTPQPAALLTTADNFGHPQIDRWRYAAGAGTNRLTILGDAGAAVVLSRRSGFARLLVINSMSLPELEAMYRSGVELFPPEPTLGLPIRSGARLAHHREHDPDAHEVGKAMLAQARVTLGKRTLADADLAPDQITRVAHVFSGGQHYIDGALGPMGIDPARGMLDLGRQLGHLAASDHVVALDHLVTTRQVGPGDHVMLIANGGGSLVCAIVEILAHPSWTS
ncbi:MAG TPA: ketoacyl-ACP synthase III family protein [Pseudonocardiaceae bacterium]|jgi:3-oxoacyl-[acyl-carrier-protein] synthase-3